MTKDKMKRNENLTGYIIMINFVEIIIPKKKDTKNEIYSKDDVYDSPLFRHHFRLVTVNVIVSSRESIFRRFQKA